MVNTHNPSTWEVQGHPQHIASSRQPWATGQLVTKGKEGEKEREWKGYRQKKQNSPVALGQGFSQVKAAPKWDFSGAR